MPNKTGNAAHDSNCQAAELAFQVAIAGSPTQAQARAADISRLSAIVASGQANGISCVNQATALQSLLKGGNT
jgi:hypothetical protein